MSKLKRVPVKMIRDYIKKDYKYSDCCYICGSTEKLELHHVYSISQLFEEWCNKNNIKEIEIAEKMMELRVAFVNDSKDLLSNSNLYTLCSTHHKRLHTIYGQKYANSLSPKIRNWINIQREKHIEQRI